jgi:hypothetical protein
MTEPRIQLLDDLGVEFARVAAEHTRRARRPRRAVAIAMTVLMLLGGAFAAPPTRAAIEDIASSLAGWVDGDDAHAPGRALRPQDDAPDWVRDESGRLIAESGGVRLYVSRFEPKQGEAQLRFTVGQGALMWDTVDGWRKRFDDHAIVVLGTAPIGRKEGVLDEQGRFPLLGVTARSVTRLELRYGDGSPLIANGIEGGFVLMADARRSLRELIAYDTAGRELERTDVSSIDMRFACERERDCPSA